MNNKGITLIELLIVVIIIGILAAIAIPGYKSYVRRARRSDAKTALQQIGAAQEMWRAENGCYAQDGVNCFGAASAGTAMVKLQNTMGVSPATISPYYTWSFTVKTATAFTAQAVRNPLTDQINDTGGDLSIDQNGTRSSIFGGNTYIYPDPNCGWTR